ncbi:hypothetical protein OG21DRAFT_1501321 [Imleria badia]|nr:hypothetical protein OG21DRAFT_1501321 [Imleria badia]
MTPPVDPTTTLTVRAYNPLQEANRRRSNYLDHEHIRTLASSTCSWSTAVVVLSGIIKEAPKHNRAVPEDTIWYYFMQILLAWQHCHHPHSNLDGKEGRPQILHRELKLDNIFLDDISSVKRASTGELRQHLCRPAMRRSAVQLLQHELLALITKVFEAEKMKTHKSAVISKDLGISARETALAEREAKLTTVVAGKDAGILSLHNFVSTAQSQLNARIREATGKREEEVAAAMARREDEIPDVRRMARAEANLEAEQSRLDEEVKNLVPRIQMTGERGHGRDKRIASTDSNIAMPVNRDILQPVQDFMPSAMKGSPRTNWSTTR